MDMITPKLALATSLPFGILSKHALNLCLMDFPEADVICPEATDLVGYADLHELRKSQLRRKRSFFNQGAQVWESDRKRAKKKVADYTTISLTQNGIDYLCNLWTPTAHSNNSNLMTALLEAMDSNKKDMSLALLSMSDQLYKTMMSDETTPDDFSEDSPKYNFLDAVSTTSHATIASTDSLSPSDRYAAYCLSLTILGLYPKLAEKITPNISKYTPSTLYYSYRLSGINALFYRCGYLSVMDRRYYDTGWNLDMQKMTDEQLERRMAEEKVMLSDYCTYTLRHYYHGKPDAYSFLNPDMTREEWLDSPVFYAARELPSYNQVFDFTDDETDAGEETDDSVKESNRRVLMFSYLGLSIGRRRAYVIHHAQRAREIFNRSIETQTIQSLNGALQTLPLTNRTWIKSVSEAIIAFESARQFAEYVRMVNSQTIRDQQAKMRSLHGNKTQFKNANTATKYTDPYRAIYMVPLNHSGAAQLRLLMDGEAELQYRSITSKMLACNMERYTPSFYKDSIFPICEQTPEGKIPIFVGHLMELNQLCTLYMEYVQGSIFKVACFPQQREYYAALLPGVEFI